MGFTLTQDPRNINLHWLLWFQDDLDQALSTDLKRHQEKASTKINISTSLELDEVGSLDSSDSDSLDADADTEPYSIEDPGFVFPSTSSGATGSKRLRSEIRSPSIALKLPRNPITNKIISNMGNRLNLSAGQRTAFMGAILTEGGVPIEKATLSIKSTWTAGKEIRKSSEQAIKVTLTAPKHATLHWDGKLVPVFKKGNKERLTILVSGMPDVVEGKVLGIPVIANTTGEKQARTTFFLANEWKISDNVKSLVFDTTASNSGWKTGACARLENLSDKNLLLLACRHPIFERIPSSVHKELFGATSSPGNTNFIEFRLYLVNY
ncbi:hypothetical protein AVEN_262593-1 [Araneus ventricosus]|uniref:Uncharacterized protein n=1 Tax=Araneus ventricosus TaxID=182803 RepID=A0A4Y2HID6_ARAVE|nr:hypothetical protein AVEN_262593-1 [Araneus ventricosus]